MLKFLALVFIMSGSLASCTLQNPSPFPEEKKETLSSSPSEENTPSGAIEATVVSIPANPSASMNAPVDNGTGSLQKEGTSSGITK